MRVRIISSPYTFGLNLPVEVDATGENRLYMVSSSELVRVGGDTVAPNFEYAFMADEVELVTSETPCVRDKCCNQFGERDEIQGIIDALQADVKARDERIKALEDALRTTSSELHGAINKINKMLNSNIRSTDLDQPDYWDSQTVHDNAVLLRDA